MADKAFKSGSFDLGEEVFGFPFRKRSFFGERLMGCLVGVSHSPPDAQQAGWIMLNARDWSKVTHQDAVQLVHQIEGGALLQKKEPGPFFKAKRRVELAEWADLGRLKILLARCSIFKKMTTSADAWGVFSTSPWASHWPQDYLQGPKVSWTWGSWLCSGPWGWFFSLYLRPFPLY